MKIIMSNNMNIFYRISSYILLVIAVIIGIAALFTLLIALSNPALLLSVFVVIAVVIYSIASFLFLINGIDGKRQLQPKLKDWIKVNGYVAIVFVVMNIFQSVTIISNPAVLNDAMKQVAEMQNNTAPVSTTLMIKVAKAIVWALLFYCVILGMHISTTFRLLKQYAGLFGPNADDTQQ